MICRSCREKFDEEKLTTYALQTYEGLCGVCIFRLIDERAEFEYLNDLCTDGGGIIDYIPCVSDEDDLLNSYGENDE